MRISILLGVTLIFMSCQVHEYIITTYVNEDGSFKKTIETTTDTTNIQLNDVPPAIDSTWEIRYSKDSSVVWGKYKMVLSKNFNNVEELNQSFLDTSFLFTTLDHSISFEKNQRFLWTDYVYSEWVGKVLNGLHLENFLSDTDLSIFTQDSLTMQEYFKDKDSSIIAHHVDSIEKIYETWIEKSIYHDFYQSLDKDLNNRLSTMNLYDSFYDSLMKYDFDLGKNDSVQIVLRQCLNDTSLIIPVHAQSNYDSFLLRQQLAGELFLFVGYKNNIVMPAPIRNTDMNEESTVFEHNMYLHDFLTRDLKLEVKSRQWYYSRIIAAIVVLLVLSNFVIFRIRKK